MIGGMKDARAMALRLAKWLGKVSPDDALALKELVDLCDALPENLRLRALGGHARATKTPSVRASG